MEQLKSLISSRTIRIRAMRRDCEEYPNYTRFINLNNRDIGILTEDERRVQYSQSVLPPLTKEEVSQLLQDTHDLHVMRLLAEELVSIPIEKDHNFTNRIVYTEDYSNLAEKSTDPIEYFLSEWLSTKLDVGKPIEVSEKDLWAAYRSHLLDMSREIDHTGAKNCKELCQILRERLDVFPCSQGPKKVESRFAVVGDLIQLDYSDMLAESRSGAICYTHKIKNAKNFFVKLWIFDAVRVIQWLRSVHEKRCRRKKFLDRVVVQ